MAEKKSCTDYLLEYDAEFTHIFVKAVLEGLHTDNESIPPTFKSASKSYSYELKYIIDRLLIWSKQSNQHYFEQHHQNFKRYCLDKNINTRYTVKEIEEDFLQFYYNNITGD